MTKDCCDKYLAEKKMEKNWTAKIKITNIEVLKDKKFTVY